MNAIGTDTNLLSIETEGNLALKLGSTSPLNIFNNDVEGWVNSALIK